MAYTKRSGGGMLVEMATTQGLSWLGPWQTINGFKGTITLPGGTPNKIDITTHDDVRTLGRIQQVAGGIATLPDVGGSVLWDPDDTVHQTILAAFQAGSVFQYRFTFSSATGTVTKKYGVQGQIGVAPVSDLNDYVTAQVTILANAVNFSVT